MRSTCLGALLGSVALVGAARPAHAEGTDDLQTMLDQSIVTTASKSAETTSAAPATSTTLTAEDMHRYGMHSLDEAIDFLSLGVVTENPLRSVDIGSRGVLLPGDQGNHFLLLVDGHAVNEPLFGAARFERGLGIPIEMVDRVEVILGPGSVLYGSNAMLGVINVITRSASAQKGAHVVAESELGKSYRAGASIGARFAIGKTPAELTFGVEYYRQDGPAFTFGPSPYEIDIATGQPVRFQRGGAPTGIWGGAARHSYWAEVPSAHARFTLGGLELAVHASSYVRATPYRSRNLNAVGLFDDPANYEVDRSAWMDAKYSVTLSRRVQAVIRAYADGFDYANYRSATGSACAEANHNFELCRYTTTGVSRWAGVELQSSVDWLEDTSFVTLLGVDERVRSVGSKNDAQDDATGAFARSSVGAFRASDKVLGSYLQQTWKATAWLDLNAGARIDAEDRFRPVLSPRFAASARTWRGGTVKAVYAEAFRSPSWIETSYASPDQAQAGTLKPETVRSGEISLEQRWSAQRILFGAFVSRWSDLVELHVLDRADQDRLTREGALEPTSQSASQYRNISSIDNYGFNAGFEGSHFDSRLHYGANVTGAVARSKSEAGTNDLEVAPRVFGNARVAYDLGGALPTVALAGHFLGSRLADRALQGGFTPMPVAPPQLELRATVSGKVPWVRGLAYRLSADYAFADRTPYVVGPVQAAHSPFITRADTAVPELAPVDTFRATLGLQYDLFE